MQSHLQACFDSIIVARNTGVLYFLGQLPQLIDMLRCEFVVLWNDVTESNAMAT